MTKYKNPAPLAAIALCAAVSAFSTGCATSRTSIFGSSTNSGSPRTATQTQTTRQARPVSFVAPRRVSSTTVTPASTVQVPHAAQASRNVAVTPHGTYLPASPAANLPSQSTGAHATAATTQATPRYAPAPKPDSTPKASTAAPTASGWRIYEVQPGDSVSKLAFQNGMRINEFCEVNGISDPDKIRIGQKVKIATGRTAFVPGSASQSAVTAKTTPTSASNRQNTQVVSSHTTHPAKTSTSVETPAKKETTGTVTTDVDALLRGGSLASQRQAAEEAAAKVAAEAKVREEAARKAAAEAEARANAEAQAARKAADEEARRLAAEAKAAEEAARKAAEEEAKKAAPIVSPGLGSDGLYVVGPDEDIYSISLKFGTTPLELRRLNGGKSLTGMQPGDRIAVPAAE